MRLMGKSSLSGMLRDKQTNQARLDNRWGSPLSSMLLSGLHINLAIYEGSKRGQREQERPDLLSSMIRDVRSKLYESTPQIHPEDSDHRMCS
jgi:hypothetical protein